MSADGAFDIARSALQAAGIRYAVGGSWAITAPAEFAFPSLNSTRNELFLEKNEPNSFRFVVLP